MIKIVYGVEQNSGYNLVERSRFLLAMGIGVERLYPFK
jgi:hypothetical protein